MLEVLDELLLDFGVSGSDAGWWSYVLPKPEYIPVISALTALTAIFVGSCVQLYLGRRQQRATVLSSNRVRWIEEFRKEFAEFIAACHLHEVEKWHVEEAKRAVSDDDLRHYRKARDTSFLRVNTLLHTIRLKLDPEDPKRPRDRDIWDLVQAIDHLTIEDFPRLPQDVDDEDRLHRFEDLFLQKAEQLKRLVRSKLSAEWEIVEKMK